MSLIWSLSEDGHGSRIGLPTFENRSKNNPVLILSQSQNHQRSLLDLGGWCCSGRGDRFLVC